MNALPAAIIARPNPADDAAARQRKARHAADRRLRFYGQAAIGLALGFLLTLFVTLVVTGHTAFTQTMVTIELDPARDVVRGSDGEINWRATLRNSYRELVPDLPRADERAYFSLFTSSGHYLLRDRVLAEFGRSVGLRRYLMPLSDPADQFAKGQIDRSLPEDQRRISDIQLAYFEKLTEAGVLSQNFNWGLFVNSDSRFPELAGLKGAIAGSFWLLAVCFAISFPAGIGAAIYLEEFAPRNRLTDFIEININNLAAVPSIVFGLLGLAVFLGTFGMPRSAPLVGGMVLSLMTLPTIIIVARSALKQVPSAITDAALALGASKHEAIFHHKLPLAMPAVLTGTIIGLAQALGETAPLLLIGMNAFITGDPGGITNPATALPTQIYIWADSPERGFVARTSAAILVLLGFLVLMNGAAIWLRHKFGKRS